MLAGLGLLQAHKLDPISTGQIWDGLDDRG